MINLQELESPKAYEFIMNQKGKTLRVAYLGEKTSDRRSYILYQVLKGKNPRLLVLTLPKMAHICDGQTISPLECGERVKLITGAYDLTPDMGRKVPGLLEKLRSLGLMEGVN